MSFVSALVSLPCAFTQQPMRWLDRPRNCSVAARTCLMDESMHVLQLSDPVYTMQPVVDSRLDNRLYLVYKHPTGCLFTRWSRLSNRSYNRYDNRLYRVIGVSVLCSACNSTGLVRLPHYATPASPHSWSMYSVEPPSVMRAEASRPYKSFFRPSATLYISSRRCG